jgi:hypothetical protein
MLQVEIRLDYSDGEFVRSNTCCGSHHGNAASHAFLRDYRITVLPALEHRFFVNADKANA